MLLFVVAIAVAAASPAQAAIIISAETVSAAPGSAGFVQILLKNDSTSPQELAGFSVDIGLSGSGVHFTGADDVTSPTYVFAGVGTGTLTFDSFPNTAFIASDVDTDFSGFVTLAPDATYGLARVSFSVDAGAVAGLRTISFATGPSTQLVDGSFAIIADASLQPGGINVLESAAPTVPEPASWMSFLGAACLLLVRSRRSRRSPFSSIA